MFSLKKEEKKQEKKHEQQQNSVWTRTLKICHLCNNWVLFEQNIEIFVLSLTFFMQKCLLAIQSSEAV